MASAPDDLPPIRLCIAHLIRWTLGSGIILACCRALDSGHEDIPEEIRRVQPFYHLGYSIALGAQVGGLLLFAWRRSINRQRDFPTQPGHWLLLVEGGSATLMLAGYGAFVLCYRDQPGSPYWYVGLQIPNLSACSVGYCLGFVNTPGGSSWRLAFATIAVVYGIESMIIALPAVSLFLENQGNGWLQVWEISHHWSGLVMGMAILVASLVDWRRHAQRDFLHWAGLAAFVVNVVLHLAYRMIVIGV